MVFHPLVFYYSQTVGKNNIFMVDGRSFTVSHPTERRLMLQLRQGRNQLFSFFFLFVIFGCFLEFRLSSSQLYRLRQRNLILGTHGTLRESKTAKCNSTATPPQHLGHYGSDAVDAGVAQYLFYSVTVAHLLEKSCCSFISRITDIV